jgi:glycosyl transferase, family 25
MKAYVINLPASSQRRVSVEQQLAGSRIEHELVEAVDGYALTAAERASLVDEAATARYPKWLTPPALGCAISHLRAYERIVEAGEGGVSLILEDDVLLPVGTSKLVAEVSAHMRGSEIVLLYFRSFEACVFSERDSVALRDGRRLIYPLRAEQPITTAAYLITVEAARRLAEAVPPIRVAADKWEYFYELGAIDSLRCVLPRPVAVRKDFKSTTGTTSPDALRSRLTSFAARHRVFPLVQLLTLNRHLIERRMSRIELVTERSPIAMTRSG